ncbi:MAG: D-arabinono-1,4-lactone oxidase [Pseudomonadota bacterium]
MKHIPLNAGRRKLLKAMGASLATATFLPACSEGESPDASFSTEKNLGIVGADGRRILPWSNWSGNLSCQPTQRETPRSIEKLQTLLQESSKPIRCVGSAHSFSPLVPTDHMLLSLARLRGLQSVDKENMTATFGAGTRLGQTGDKLWEQGMGLLNMPDIDTQTLAGSTATSTHGTGRNFGSLSSDVAAMSLVDASGELHKCSATENTDLFNAARNHLGSLGVVVDVTLRIRESYKIEEKKWFLPAEEAYDMAEALNQSSRHFEMFTFPHADYVLMQTLDETELDETPPPVDDSANTLAEMKVWTDRLPWLKSFLLNTALKNELENIEQRVNRSYRVFGNVRSLKFNEMEYSVPAERGLECLEEVMATIKQHNANVVFPLEFRYIKADDVWLSPFYQRDSCAISCHQFHDEPFQEYFALLEPIFLKYDGRPHWGKINTLTATQFAEKYEMWEPFKAVRKQIDPAGRFFNQFTESLFA